MRLLIIALVLLTSGCKGTETAVIIEAQPKKSPTVKVELRYPN